MPVQTLQPNGTKAIVAATVEGGAANAHGATSDNSDATFVSFPGSGTSLLVLEMGTLTIGADERVWACRARVRYVHGFGGVASYASMGYDLGSGYVTVDADPLNYATGTIADKVGAWRSGPFGAAGWSQAEIDNLLLVVDHVGGAPMHVYKAWVDVFVLARCTVSVSAPSGSNPGGTRRPTVQWTHSQTDGRAQSAAQVRIFPQATYEAGGFDPSTASTPWASPTLPAGVSSWTPSSDLPDGTYRAYVRTAQDFHGEHWYSAWSYSQFTIASLTPVPTAVTPADGTVNSTGRVVLGCRVAAPSFGDPVRAQWQIDTSASFSSPTTYSDDDGYIDAASAPNRSHTVPALLNSGTYYVRARADAQASSDSSWSAAQEFTVSHPPNATLQHPLPGDTVDLPGAGGIFTWTMNDTKEGGDTQDAFAFRRRVEGSNAYEWWDGDEWVDAEEFIETADAELEFDPGEWDEATRYLWSVRLRDDDGTEGPYSEERLVISAGPPTVTVTGPSDPEEDTTSPTATWVFADPLGRPMTGYRHKVFEAAVFSDGGFDPETSPAVYDSGDVGVAALSDQCTADLDDGETYRSYVRVAATGVDGVQQWSEWDHAEYDIDVDTPDPSTITTAVWDAVEHGAQITLPTYSQGSVTAAYRIVEVSRDGGTTWRPLRGGEVDVSETEVHDREMPPGETSMYRVRAIAYVGDHRVASLPSAAEEVLSMPDQIMLRDPSDSSRDMAVTVISYDEAKPTTGVRKDTIGSDYALVVYEDDDDSNELPVRFRALSQAEFEGLMLLLTSKRTLLLQDVLPGRQWYVRPVGEVRKTPLRAAPSAGETSPRRFAYEIGVTFVEVEAPA